MTRIRPQTYRGVFDLSPPEAAARQGMIEAVCDVYRRYGYLPLATPSLERLDVLTGEVGEETTREIFAWKDPDEIPLGLRFDLTVSLARHFAANQQDIARPFRRYQVGACWRMDKPDMAFGRFREFVQCDIDAVGAASVITDAELLAAEVEALRVLEVPGVDVRVSNRKVLASVVSFAGLEPGSEADVLRVVDKLDKVGRDAVLEELGEGRVDASGAPIPGLGLPAEAVQKLGDFLDLTAERTSRAEAIDRVARLLGDLDGADEGLSELREMNEAFDILELDEGEVRFDLSIARGLAYYTGPVFETHLRDLPRFGAISAGGRYDRLVERFGGQRVPGTGVSIGIDRLLAALRELEALPVAEVAAEVMVAVMKPNLRLPCLRMARELRQAGLRTELYVGTQKQLGKQLQYADKQGIAVVVLAGEDELAAQQVTVKEMGEAKEAADDVADHDDYRQRRFGQRTVPAGEMVAQVKEALRIYRSR